MSTLFIFIGLFSLPGVSAENTFGSHCKFYPGNFIKRNHFSNILVNDTIIRPIVNSVNNIDNKIILSDGDNRIEFSPSSSINNGALIQPVKASDNTGVSTAFYLTDSASWMFYTDSKQRLSINGNGSIISSVPLLINTNNRDIASALRVNGNTRIDSSLSLQANSDSLSFISFHRNIESLNSPQDGTSPYTSTPTAWAINHNIPVFRIRHPNNTSLIDNPSESLKRDFMILPYEYGMAIEYNGVVECWVGGWSIHKGVNYNDVEGQGNGWGALLWVGDDVDRGGIRATARNNTSLGGNVAYGEISVEKFIGEPNGDLRLRLPSVNNSFHFVYGGTGSTNIVAKLNNKGIFIPKVSSVYEIVTPEISQIAFDSTDAQFKGYNGLEWVTLANNGLKTGSFKQSAKGSDLIFLIPHGLPDAPSYFNVVPTSQEAANISYVTANSTFLFIHYTTPPSAGTGNLSWNWQVKK